MQKPLILTYQGKTRTLEEWAKMYNINRNTLDGRLRLKWSMEKALNTPSKQKKHWWDKLGVSAPGVKSTRIAFKREQEQIRLINNEIVEKELKSNRIVQRRPHKRRCKTFDKPLSLETSIPKNWEIKVDNGIDVYREIMMRRCNKSITKLKYEKFRNVFEDIELNMNSKPIEAEMETETEKDAIIILRGGKIYNEIMERYQLECA